MALAQAVKNVRSDPRWTEQYMRKIVEEYISSGTPLPESVDSLRREMRR
jgi:hypothetical protein